MSPLRRNAAVIAVFLLAAPLVSALRAQATASDSLERVNVTAPAPTVVTQSSLLAPANTERQAPSARVIAAGVTQRVAATASAPTVFARATQESRNPAMMVVGGAAMIVGAVVGGKAGSIVMIGGGILGLVGLWNYLQ
jgi:hypothetical protein